MRALGKFPDKKFTKKLVNFERESENENMKKT